MSEFCSVCGHPERTVYQRLCVPCFDGMIGSSGDWTFWFDNVEIDDIIFGYKVETPEERDIIRAMGALLKSKK